MKKTWLLPILVISLFMASCGGEEGASDEEGEDKESTEETSNIEESVSAQVTSENADLTGVDFKYVTAFKYGRVVNGTKERKSYVVVLSDQEITLSDMYMYTAMPKPGQHYVLMEFLGEFGEEGVTPDEVPTGDFKIGSMLDPGKLVAVFCNVGTEKGQDMLLKQQQNPQGIAKLTKAGSKGVVAGSVDLSLDGFTLKADFTTLIEKDYWALAQEQKKKAMEMLK